MNPAYTLTSPEHKTPHSKSNGDKQQKWTNLGNKPLKLYKARHPDSPQAYTQEWTSRQARSMMMDAYASEIDGGSLIQNLYEHESCRRSTTRQ